MTEIYWEFMFEYVTSFIIGVEDKKWRYFEGIVY